MTYSIQLFMDKNKDLLFTDLSKAMFACERALLKELFPEGSEHVDSGCGDPRGLVGVTRCGWVLVWPGCGLVWVGMA